MARIVSTRFIIGHNRIRDMYNWSPLELDDNEEIVAETESQKIMERKRAKTAERVRRFRERQKLLKN